MRSRHPLTKPNGNRKPAARRKPPSQRDRLPLIWTSDVSAADIGLPELVEDIFTRSGLSVTYGPSGCGKSYMSLHMDCAIRAWRHRAR